MKIRKIKQNFLLVKTWKKKDGDDSVYSHDVFSELGDFLLYRKLPLFRIPDLTVGTIITTTASANSVECFMLSALCI